MQNKEWYYCGTGNCKKMSGMIQTAEEMEQLVVRNGFMPFFSNGIPDFSIEEETPAELWFDDECPGPWEWKGTVIGMGSAAYGKFFDNKAGYVRLDLFPDFLNYRRRGLSAEAALKHDWLTKDEGLVLQTVVDHQSLLTTELRRLCGYTKPRSAKLSPIEKQAERSAKQAGLSIKKVNRNTGLPSQDAGQPSHTAVQPRSAGRREGLETAITHLQMKGYLVTIDFEYKYDREGKRYGWGVARYCTPEDCYGANILDGVRGRSPEQSYARLFQFLRHQLPQATDEQLHQLLR